MDNPNDTGAPENKRARPRKTAAPDAKADWVETITFWIVGIGLAVIPLLLFFFSFGNVGSFLESLSVEHRIAYLTGPAVDIAVMVLVIAASYLSMRGRTEGQLWPLHLAALVCGLIMIALNIAGAIHVRHWRLAAVDSVGPVMLIGWGALAPWLWRNLTAARRGDPPAAAAPQTPAATRQQTRHPAPAAAPALPPSPGSGAATDPAAGGSRTPAVKPAAAAPARQTAAPSGGNVFAFDTGRRSPADWAVLALPLWDRHIDTTGSAPTAKELCALLRHAHPTLSVPGSERAARNIRSATEELAAGRTDSAQTDEKIEREEVG